MQRNRVKQTFLAIGLVLGALPCIVEAAPIDKFVLSGPLSVPAGSPFSLTVTAEDALNNVVPLYTGTVDFSSSDFLAILPASYTFVLADSGQHMFSMVFNTIGTDQVTAFDDANRAISGFARVSVVAPVPEPETYAMVLIALGLLGFMARRGKQREAAVA